MGQAALKTVSDTSSGESKSKLKVSPSAWEYLRPSLPAGWGHFFQARRSGRYWGLAITCPICNKRPETEIYSWNRWRWLAVHIATKHPQPQSVAPATLRHIGRR